MSKIKLTEPEHSVDTRDEDLSTPISKIPFHRPNSNPEFLEVYLRYEKLDNYTFLKIISTLEKLKDEIISHLKKINYSELAFYSNKGILPSLEIEYIKTGNSIILKFKDGWVPKLDVSGGDIIIEVPKLIGICGLVVYGIFKAYNLVLDTKIKQETLIGLKLDHKGKKIENENKQLDLNERKDLLNKEKLKSITYLDSLKIETDTLPIYKNAKKIIRDVSNSQTLNTVRVNQIFIKDNQ